MFKLNKIRNFWNNLDEKSGPRIEAVCAVIQVAASVAIITLTVITVVFNNNLLDQQKAQENIQFRAYLYVDELYFKSSEGNWLNTAIKIKNSGLTPATEVGTKIKSSISGKEIETNFQIMISREEKTDIDFTLAKKAIKEFSRGSGNFLLIEISYLDYQKNKYVVSSKHQIFKDPVDGMYRFTTFDGNENFMIK